MAKDLLGRRGTPHKRRYNLRLIKRTWPYTVQEIAELFGIHKNAVLRWLKEGLVAQRDHRPFLIPGHELERFLRARQAKRRCKCRPTEFYCFKCRAPREPYLGIADVVIENPFRLRVKALCSVCSTAVSKVQRVQDLAKIQSLFHVQQLAERHMPEAISPSLNRDLKGTT
jgi:excisionase family DNA binding protein